MTDTVSSAQPPRDLAARLFRALYYDFDLWIAGDLHVAVPKGTLWYSGRSLSELALQIVTAAPPPCPATGVTSHPVAPVGRAGHVIRLAPHGDVLLTHVLREYPQWSVFWDKRYGLWRVTEDDPDSVLYAEDPDLDTVISYITSHA